MPDKLSFTMRRVNCLIVTVFILFIVGCTSLNEVKYSPKFQPIAGAWDYRIESTTGPYTGKLLISPEGEDLQISITEDGEEESIYAENIVFDSEPQTLSFSFLDDQYGIMNVSLTLVEERMSGILRVTQYGLDLTMTATRPAQSLR